MLFKYATPPHGRITTFRKKLLNSLRTSKQGHALMYSDGSTSPLPFKSGEVSRWPSSSIIGYSLQSFATKLRKAFFCASVFVVRQTGETFRITVRPVD